MSENTTESFHKKCPHLLLSFLTLSPEPHILPTQKARNTVLRWLEPPPRFEVVSGLLRERNVSKHWAAYPKSESSPTTAAPSTRLWARMVSGSFFCYDRDTNTSSREADGPARAAVGGHRWGLPPTHVTETLRYETLSHSHD